MTKPNYFKFLTIFSVAIVLAFTLQGSFDARANEEIHAKLERWTGDFDGMLERRQIRALVVYNKLMYFVDGPQQHGISYDLLQEFEKFINENNDVGDRKLTIIYIPVTRAKIASYLNEGIGDIAVANLTITPERQELYDFSDPLYSGVQEVLITGPSAPEIATLSDLSGKTILARESSSYYENLQKLNKQFEADGLDPVEIRIIDESLEDEDLIEMVSAEMLPMMIMDSTKANFWGTIFDNLTIRQDIAINSGGDIGWGFRKNSPELAAVANQFIAENKKGTMIGNTILNRYLKNNKWVNNALEEEDVERLQLLKSFFQTYGNEYNFDWLMLAALGFQESRLDQSVVSPSGAVGIMQLLQSTASDPNVDIHDISVIENNIHAGTKYLRFIRNRYFNDPQITPLNQTLLSFASYNAGPARIASIREETSSKGLDPNVWFGNVEHVVAEDIGRETLQYVSNIYKYFIAYTLITQQDEMRDKAKSELSEDLQ